MFLLIPSCPAVVSYLPLGLGENLTLNGTNFCISSTSGLNVLSGVSAIVNGISLVSTLNRSVDSSIITFFGVLTSSCSISSFRDRSRSLSFCAIVPSSP
jgi:hypothetical protein